MAARKTTFGMRGSPMTDKTKAARKVPQTGPDFDKSKQNAGKPVVELPDRDGPARDTTAPKVAKPKTHARPPGKVAPTPNPAVIAAMKSSISKIGRYDR